MKKILDCFSFHKSQIDYIERYFILPKIIKKEKNENNNLEEAIFIVMQKLFIHDVTRIPAILQRYKHMVILSSYIAFGSIKRSNAIHIFLHIFKPILVKMVVTQAFDVF